MQYLISDIHGNLRDFKQLLNKIALNRKKDTLIILGDILDRGPDGINILKFIEPYLIDNSMHLLMGNHELFAIMYLEGNLYERKWSLFGGGNTINSIKKMTVNEKKELLEFLESLPYYMEISSEIWGDTIVTHTGIDCDNYVFNKDNTINIKESIKKAIKYNLYNYMIGNDLHQIPESDKRKFDRFLIVGHVPCFILNDDMCNKFYRSEFYMDIDSGSGHKEQGGCLGCYCVTTDEEIYI